MVGPFLLVIQNIRILNQHHFLIDLHDLIERQQLQILCLHFPFVIAVIKLQIFHSILIHHQIQNLIAPGLHLALHALQPAAIFHGISDGNLVDLPHIMELITGSDLFFSGVSTRFYIRIPEKRIFPFSHHHVRNIEFCHFFIRQFFCLIEADPDVTFYGLFIRNLCRIF